MSSILLRNRRNLLKLQTNFRTQSSSEASSSASSSSASASPSSKATDDSPLPPPMSANSALYHMEPADAGAFYGKLHKLLSVIPHVSSGFPKQSLNRNPTPASRTEEYVSPISQAADIASNPYYTRDSRRAYNRISFIPQQTLAKLLVQAPEAFKIQAPSAGEGSGSDISVGGKQGEGELSLGQVLEMGAKSMYSPSSLPPMPPGALAGRRMRLSLDKRSQPHGPDEYWPLEAYN